MSNNNNGNPLFTGLLLGVIAGVVTTMLYTPKPGKEVRNDIQGKIDELPDEANKLLDDIRDLYNKSAELLISVSKEQCSRLSNALNEAEKTVKSKMGKSSDEQ
ncbi:MAG: YtxH domain-containing protein [Candidatus Caenarcaniphilales bacterium]|nr:YtxH domain-containing protein [Candidatus Caenarcaniphilales bacterium]